MLLNIYTYMISGKLLFLFFSITLSFVSEGPADDIDRGGGGAAFQGGGLNQGMNKGGDPGMEIYELYLLIVKSCVNKQAGS